MATCASGVTPDCIAAIYNIPTAKTTVPNPCNVMGMYQTNNQFWDQPDLDAFFSLYTPSIPNGTHPADQLIDGGIAVISDPNATNFGGESMLDIQLSYPIIWPQGIKLFDSDDARVQAWYNNTWTYGFNTFLDAIDGSYCFYSAYNETGDMPGLDPKYPDPSPNGYNGTLQCGVFEPTVSLTC